MPTDYGRLAFDENGVRNQADFDVFNLVAEKSGIRRWKVSRLRLLDHYRCLHKLSKYN